MLVQSYLIHSGPGCFSISNKITEQFKNENSTNTKFQHQINCVFKSFDSLHKDHSAFTKRWGDWKGFGRDRIN